MSHEKYRVLRGLLKDGDFDRAYILAQLDMATDTYYRTLRGERPWTQTEMYTLLDMLDMPYTAIPIVFPAGGMYAGELVEEAPLPESVLGSAVAEYIMQVVVKERRPASAANGRALSIVAAPKKGSTP